VNPTILFTVAVNSQIEVTPSVKALVPLESFRRGENLFALNLGIGWSPGEAAWTIRPEAGLFWGSDNDLGRASHAGIGVTLPVGR
jgi:hypothetical protein